MVRLTIRDSRVGVARLETTLLLLCAVASLVRGQQPSSTDRLVRQFESETVFWKQFEIAQAIVAAHDPRVLPKLESWLMHEDRHLRGNAAFIFAGLGDPRGFDVIVTTLGDRSERRQVNKISSAGLPWVQGQITEDRYYATHLLGDLKDPRAIPILVPLLTDSDLNYIVPWSLGRIGDHSAVPALIGSLGDRNPSIRVLTIYALVELKATEALPRLRQLLDDDQRSNFGQLESVANAAQAAIVKLQPLTAR